MFHTLRLVTSLSTAEDWSNICLDVVALFECSLPDGTFFFFIFIFLACSEIQLINVLKFAIFHHLIRGFSLCVDFCKPCVVIYGNKMQLPSRSNTRRFVCECRSSSSSRKTVHARHGTRLTPPKLGRRTSYFLGPRYSVCTSAKDPAARRAATVGQAAPRHVVADCAMRSLMCIVKTQSATPALLRRKMVKPPSQSVCGLSIVIIIKIHSAGTLRPIKKIEKC